MPPNDPPFPPSSMHVSRAPALVASFAAVAFAGFVVMPLGIGRAEAAAPHRFGLAIHAVAGIDAGFLPERIALSNQLFANAGVSFEQVSSDALDARHARLVTRSDRDALGTYRTQGAIDVFLVNALVDVDDPPLPRRGVHWRDRTRRGVRYIIVVGSSSAWVFPHELGHYFGNAHSDVVGNLMCYERGNVTPFFDTMQLGRIRRMASHLARGFGRRR